MRIWMLASLLFAVTAIGGDRVIATSSRSNPFDVLSSPIVRLRLSAAFCTGLPGGDGGSHARLGIRVVDSSAAHKGGRDVNL